MSSPFDISILSAPLEGSNATKRDPLPAMETYGQILKQELASGTVKQGANEGKPWYKLNVVIDIQDPECLQRAQRDKATITYGVMLEMNDGGGVAMGPNKNVTLGKLRDATGTNLPGKTLADMVGQYVRLVISHRPDPNDASIVYDEVKAVAKY